MSSEAARSLAEARAKSAATIAALPAPPTGHHYRTGFGGIELRKTLHRVGSVAVHKDDHAAKPSWVVVDAVSGYAFGSFGKAGPAKRLCAALGVRVDEYWARAAQGGALAATTIARLSRIHKTRERGRR
jgi:hypothetical protein